MGLRQCGPQFLSLCLVEPQLDLSSVAARLGGSPVWFVRGSFPTEPVTREAHPYPLLDLRMVSLARLQPDHGRRSRVRFVIQLTGLHGEDRYKGDSGGVRKRLR
ncbi:hypothetical protein Taro_005227 [Colocasia esculenta]|uniref:Uncharacterized protein n=1 Tax=Colocasia esculenta TaxID=4460 RepID=A0A843TTR5_COLES|nr:hypothetical protein [Colocasia esculenta]